MGMKYRQYIAWLGVLAVILYSLPVALNIGAEFAGFTLLPIPVLAIGYRAFPGRHRGILSLQLFYATSAIIGMSRWFRQQAARAPRTRPGIRDGAGSCSTTVRTQEAQRLDPAPGHFIRSIRSSTGPGRFLRP